MRKLALFTLLLGHLSLSAQSDLIVLDFEHLQDRLDANKDTVHVVNFWATWCKPCVEELPYFEQLQEKIKDHPIKVTLVSLDFKNQLDAKLKPFLSERNLRSNVIVLYERNPNDWIDKIDPSWSGAIPATLFVHDSGSKFVEGQFENIEQIEDIINSFY